MNSYSSSSYFFPQFEELIGSSELAIIVALHCLFFMALCCLRICTFIHIFPFLLVVEKLTIILFFAEVGRIGIGICYDIRFQELAMIYAARGLFLPYIDSRIFFYLIFVDLPDKHKFSLPICIF